MKKNVILLLIAMAVAQIISNIHIVAADGQNDKLVEDISSKIIRFHVIANSDSDFDQALKLEVKNAVIEYTKPLLEQSSSIQETRSIIDANSENIIDIAKNIIKKNGCDYTVNMCYENCYFPAKTYGDITFPPGNYNSFKINIGKSEGRNWWCVLYPPLCFVDAVHGVVPDSSKLQLEEALGYEDYKALIYGVDDDKYTVTYKFKFLTFLN